MIRKVDFLALFSWKVHRKKPVFSNFEAFNPRNFEHETEQEKLSIKSMIRGLLFWKWDFERKRAMNLRSV
ncbi:MAG: hypothetical protein AB7H48_05115 [Parachlamydiales bacterium]